MAAIAHGCDWLVATLSRVCSRAAREASTLGHPPSSFASSSSSSRDMSSSFVLAGAGAGTGTGSGGGEYADTTSNIPLSNGPHPHPPVLTRQETQDLRASLWEALRGGLRDLSRLAEEAMALLRGETQAACFFHLHRIAGILKPPLSSLPPPPSGGNTGMGTGSTLPVAPAPAPSPHQRFGFLRSSTGRSSLLLSV